MITLVTACNGLYMPRALKYLRSVQQYSYFDRNYVVCVDSDVFPAGVLDRYNKIKGLPLSKDRIKILNSNFNIQHGEFLPLLDCTREDTVIYADGDMILNRPIDSEELKMITGLKSNQILLQYCVDSKETLEGEATRIRPTQDLSPLDQVAPNWRKTTVYSTGVIIASHEAYSRLYGLYVELFPKISPFFNHYAIQQWVISYIIGNYGFEVKVLPHSFYTHLCYGLPEDCELINEKVHSNSKRVFITHGDI